jgi:hypothetical protein
MGSLSTPHVVLQMRHIKGARGIQGRIQGRIQGLANIKVWQMP